LPGLRMVVFSVLLLAVVIYRQQGLMGKKEFSWNLVLNSPLLSKVKSGKKVKSSKKVKSNKSIKPGDSPDGGR
jgi:branched-chain amino acid transport system permease protein